MRALAAGKQGREILSLRPIRAWQAAKSEQTGHEIDIREREFMPASGFYLSRIANHQGDAHGFLERNVAALQAVRPEHVSVIGSEHHDGVFCQMLFVARAHQAADAVL